MLLVQPTKGVLTQTRMTLSLPPLKRRLPALCSVKTLPRCPRSTLHSHFDPLEPSEHEGGCPQVAVLITSMHVCAGTDIYTSEPATQIGCRLKQGELVGSCCCGRPVPLVRHQASLQARWGLCADAYLWSLRVAASQTRIMASPPALHRKPRHMARSCTVLQCASALLLATSGTPRRARAPSGSSCPSLGCCRASLLGRKPLMVASCAAAAAHRLQEGPGNPSM